MEKRKSWMKMTQVWLITYNKMLSERWKMEKKFNKKPMYN